MVRKCRTGLRPTYLIQKINGSTVVVNLQDIVAVRSRNRLKSFAPQLNPLSVERHPTGNLLGSEVRPRVRGHGGFFEGTVGQHVAAGRSRRRRNRGLCVSIG
jgi:hypothetical protein